MDKFVSVQKISMNYHSPQGETEAIKNVSFDIAEGEFVSIIGPSGCGNAPPTIKQRTSRPGLMFLKRVRN